MNMMRTALLMAAMTALFVGIGYLLGGEIGLIVALAVAGGMNLFAYWNSDKVVLRMHKAREVDARAAPEYYGIVRQLAERAELPMPKVYLIDKLSPTPSPPAATRKMPPWPRPRACSGCSRSRSSPASWRTSWPTSGTATL